jgi:hypothetical protein
MAPRIPLAQVLLVLAAIVTTPTLIEVHAMRAFGAALAAPNHARSHVRRVTVHRDIGVVLSAPVRSVVLFSVPVTRQAKAPVSTRSTPANSTRFECAELGG